ncbi:MAG: dTDP-glucose 4,6-dehydratase [Verrucomicrobiota bacterium]
MRILVTGGSGFIGSHLVRTLVRRGVEVLNIDKLTYAGNPASLADVEGEAGYHFLQADITDSAAMRATFSDFRPDSVMHLAAESHVDRSIDAPASFMETNIMGTFALLQAARETWGGEMETKRFLHVSTDEVYGALGADGHFSEESRYDPRSPYSASKAASDHLVRAWHHTYGLPVIVTNCSNNYGPFQFPEKLIPLVILKALRGEPIPVYGTGENVRDWIHVRDHVDALLTILEGGRVGETYNIGGNHELRNIDLVRLLCRILDGHAAVGDIVPNHDGESFADLITFVADRPGHDFRYAIDSSKLCSELGWNPSRTPDAGFSETVRWYLENPDWWQDILQNKHQLGRLGGGTGGR